jgi:hypothetical protein
MTNNVTNDIIDILSNDFETFPKNSSNITNSSQNSTEPTNSYTTGNSIFIPPTVIFLDEMSIPEGDYMNVYSTSPYTIQRASIISKLPCNEDGLPAIAILLGNKSNFKNVTLEDVIEPLQSGDLCSYRIDIDAKASDSISEIVLQNNSTDDVEFPSTSNIIVGVTKINLAYNITQ